MKKTIPLSIILASLIALAACHAHEPDGNYSVIIPCPTDQNQNCVIDDERAFEERRPTYDDGTPK